MLVCLLFWGIISWHASNKLLVENLLASTLRIHSFSAHYAVLQAENRMKRISTNQSSHYRKYVMFNRWSACPSYWYKCGCVALTWCIITLCFASSSLNVWLTFQPKNEVPLLTLHLPMSRTKAITCVRQIVTYAVQR